MNEDYPVYTQLSTQKLSQLGFDDFYLDEETCLCPYYFNDSGREVCILTDPGAQRCDYCPDIDTDIE
ncbi:hypothetical protein CLI64_29610 (plasmid) [Nostoc sp. CENA543]|uniref:hypothetical protein n=1 Tax=Nostoc sp. CENA543 TaxID=1869241 RepID=UPI000CA29245|nr:hypothetical protein [Nostoc sp. CENA543]AUT04598.1 hypothetical protein CLI64_29610 [Nostoc sp. CENA543]